MHVLETEVTKAKANLLGLVRPLQKDICSTNACHKYSWSLGDFLTNVSGPRDSSKAQKALNGPPIRTCP